MPTEAEQVAHMMSTSATSVDSVVLESALALQDVTDCAETVTVDDVQNVLGAKERKGRVVI